MINSDEVRQRLEMLADDELVSILQDRDEDEWQPEVLDSSSTMVSSSERQVWLYHCASCDHKWSE
jgi:hypothetical protein